MLCPEGAPNHERTQRDIYGKQGWIIIKDPVIIIIKQVIITIKNLVIIISKVGLDYFYEATNCYFVLLFLITL